MKQAEVQPKKTETSRRRKKTEGELPGFSVNPEKWVTDPEEAKAAVAKITGVKPVRIVAFEDETARPEIMGDLDAGAKKKSAAKTGKGGGAAESNGKAGATGKSAKAKTGRAKAKKPNEKITPASILKKMLTFGKAYQIESEQDFIEAARIYAEEAGLIDQMRDQIAEEGLTVIKSYKTGDVPVAHPLLSELPRHVESANKCLSTIGTMIGERGARVEKAKRDLDAFRLH